MAYMMHRVRAVDRADLADLLTLARMVMSPLITWLLASRRADAATVLVGFAWMADFFDGRLARTAARTTRLHRWDLRTDAWLGVCLAAGLGMGGYFSWWVIGPLIGLVGAGLLLLSNPAPLALSVGIMFGLFVWSVTVGRGFLWWLPGVYVATALLASWYRFFRIILPAVFGGLLSLVVGGRGQGRGVVLDDWVD